MPAASGARRFQVRVRPQSVIEFVHSRFHDAFVCGLLQQRS